MVQGLAHRMHLRFLEIDDSDVPLLAAWMPMQTWPFHAPTRLDAADVFDRARTCYFFGNSTRSFWALADDGAATVGLVRIFDLADVTPLVDLRVGNAFRNQGAGTMLLRWATQWVFDTFPGTHRFGGYTRHDNLSMRRVFDKSGFLQEAYHHQAWRIDATTFADAVGYAMLRNVWNSKGAS
jgi:RimJ/RimL family protein N-acetyltransferase